MRHRLLTAAAGVLMLTFWAAPAQAEIVFLVSGRSVSVKTHRVEGDKIILTLRSGGEVTCDRSLVDRILSDEVPYPEPVAAAQAESGEVPAALSNVLES